MAKIELKEDAKEKEYEIICIIGHTGAHKDHTCGFSKINCDCKIAKGHLNFPPQPTSETISFKDQAQFVTFSSKLFSAWSTWHKGYFNRFDLIYLFTPFYLGKGINLFILVNFNFPAESANASAAFSLRFFSNLLLQKNKKISTQKINK